MPRTTLLVAAVLAVGAGLSLLGAFPWPAWLPRWLVWLVGLGSAAVALNELLGKPAFFLRWSVIRMGLGARNLLRNWQVGDGREQKVADFVVSNARAGDVDHAIQLIDEFGYRQSFLMNVGDEKGEILDAALRRSGAKRVLEVGAYVGYSALRIARQLPSDGRVYSVEFSTANAAVARRIIEHAGMGDRASDVIASQRPVEMDRGTETLDSGVRRLVESSSPRLLARRHAGNLAVPHGFFKHWALDVRSSGTLQDVGGGDDELGDERVGQRGEEGTPQAEPGGRGQEAASAWARASSSRSSEAISSSRAGRSCA